MPTISYFYGITITMHWREGDHLTPHFHARYAEHKASFDLAGQVIAGELPKRQLRLVQAWVEVHADELTVDWDLVVSKKSPKPIDPLR
jgi:Domain of unknown function (DUF4160)